MACLSGFHYVQAETWHWYTRQGGDNQYKSHYRHFPHEQYSSINSEMGSIYGTGSLPFSVLDITLILSLCIYVQMCFYGGYALYVHVYVSGWRVV